MSPAKKPTILTIDQILEVDDLKEDTIDVPEWGGAVKVKQLSRVQWTDTVKRASESGTFDEELFDLLFLIDSVIEPKLTEDRVEQLRGKNAIVVAKLVRDTLAFNGVSQGALEAAVAMFQDDD